MTTSQGSHCIRIPGSSRSRWNDYSQWPWTLAFALLLVRAMGIAAPLSRDGSSRMKFPRSSPICIGMHQIELPGNAKASMLSNPCSRASVNTGSVRRPGCHRGAIGRPRRREGIQVLLARQRQGEGPLLSGDRGRVDVRWQNPAGGCRHRELVERPHGELSVAEVRSSTCHGSC